MPRAGPSGEQLFEPEEVNRLIPRLEAVLGKMAYAAERRQTVAELVEDLEAYWGDQAGAPENPDREEYVRLRAEADYLEGVLDGGTVEIQNLGGRLKSAEMGLVDFYHLLDGSLVFLCWRRGEGVVGHWHPLGKGFDSRRPLKRAEPP